MTMKNLPWQQRLKDHLTTAKKPLVVLLGPTASGKTGFSVQLAKWAEQELGRTCEVVNADSRQLYMGMNIGTAKVTAEEMQGVPHHLLSTLKPSEQSTAGGYKHEAEAIIDDILGRGNVPLLVGGSMLYLAAITDGLSFNPEKNDELRSPEAKCAYDLLVFGLGKDRDTVVANINNRTEAMFAAGWVDEVRDLLAADYTVDDPGFVACGYREIAKVISSGADTEPLKEQIAAKTRQYARRQMTWWRGDTRINWL